MPPRDRANIPAFYESYFRNLRISPEAQSDPTPSPAPALQQGAEVHQAAEERINNIPVVTTVTQAARALVTNLVAVTMSGPPAVSPAFVRIIAEDWLSQNDRLGLSEDDDYDDEEEDA